jgi:5-methyltetrahydrofolate--homocysteine methyltransferase
MAISDIYNAVLNYEMDRVKQLVQAELRSGTEITTILNQGLIPTMDKVGQLFSDGKLFIPEMLMAAKAMQCGMEILKPHLSKAEAKSKGVIVIGTVKGDLHDIGKKLVAMMLEGAGFQIVDLGVDVSTQDFIAAAKNNNAGIIAMSALLTTTMPSMAEMVKLVKENNLPCRIIVGGAPVTHEFADKIGADGYGADAPGAVRMVKQLLKV